MKKTILSIILCAGSVLPSLAQKPDTLWIKSDNRFEANKFVEIADVDSIEFKRTSMNFYYNENSRVPRLPKTYSGLLGSDLGGSFVLENPGRILFKPSTYWSNDYTNNNSQWSFQRSMESEHFVVFWEKGFGDDPTTSSMPFNPRSMLNDAEKIWKVYVDKLGFITPGSSTTDTYKIIMLVFYTSDWVASGSGVDNKVGLLNVSPWAISSRSGQTVAHEIGHTFQYLVSCDLGMSHGLNYGYGVNASGGNGWWESCANWQAYKVYPNLQFTDGEYYEGYLNYHHMSILNEVWRYQNCFMQDWWCMKHGENFIGRIWREATKPEDPVEAYMRITGLSLEEFNDEQYEGCARAATWDIDGVRNAAKHRIGSHVTHLHKAANNEDYWEVDSAYCPENHGYSIINLTNISTPGTLIKAHFKGIAGANGYRKVNLGAAGWRYGLVAYTSDGKRSYSDMGRAKEGTVELLVPDKCSHLFFVVMGAPTQYWRHPWDDDPSNDEQWPYQVKFTNTNISGRAITDKDDYEAKDTTIVINAELSASATDTTSVMVQYDINAASEAFGISSSHLMKVSKLSTANPRFVGVNSSGTARIGTTTESSSDTCFGHTFTAEGDICFYSDEASALTAEFYPADYSCKISQIPGKLTSGQTYTTRQAVQLLKGTKRYTATYVVNVKVK